MDWKELRQSKLCWSQFREFSLIIINEKDNEKVKNDSFCFESYNQVLNLTNLGNLKLYIDGYEDLPEDVRFDGSIEKYKDFVKLIGQLMNANQVKECLNTTKIWETMGIAPELHVADRMANIFKWATVKDDKLKKHYDMVWVMTDFAHTLTIHKRVVGKPNDIISYNWIRNQSELKDIVL